jgi:hypothetical protein
MCAARQPLLAFLFRWRGHVAVNGETPSHGWWSIGAYGNYRQRPGGSHFALRLNRSEPAFTRQAELMRNRCYIFKISAPNSTGEPGGTYRFKVWPADQPEPESWLLTARDGADDLERGSLLLIAHKVDDTFGNVTVAPLDPLPDN